jgi:3-phenylpropionate/cinnamic acid dioxygenase small subunit
MAVDERAVEKFIYREALYMDENRYDDWLSLWADECEYYIPANDDNAVPYLHAAIVRENRTGISDRIEQLKSGLRWAQEPRSRLRHIISNIEIENGQGDEIVVYSNFNVVELRKGMQTTYAGRTLHKLKPEGDNFKIVYKKVMLLNNDDAMGNLTFLI